MKNIDKSELVKSAQAAMGDTFGDSFWSDVVQSLDAIESRKSKSKLQVKPRNLTTTPVSRHFNS